MLIRFLFLLIAPFELKLDIFPSVSLPISLYSLYSVDDCRNGNELEADREFEFQPRMTTNLTATKIFRDF